MMKAFRALGAEVVEKCWHDDGDPRPDGWFKTQADALAAWVEPEAEAQTSVDNLESLHQWDMAWWRCAKCGADIGGDGSMDVCRGVAAESAPPSDVALPQDAEPHIPVIVSGEGYAPIPADEQYAEMVRDDSAANMPEAIEPAPSEPEKPAESKPKRKPGRPRKK